MDIVYGIRPFTKLCFGFLFLLIFTLHPESVRVEASEREKIIAGPENAVSDNLHVSGRFLLSANGVNFIMRGVNHGHTWFVEESTAFQHIKAKGANTVRMVLSSDKLWEKIVSVMLPV